MYSYVKRASITMLCMLIVIFASAQQQRQRMSAQERAQRETEMMKKELNPTKEQLKQIDSINLVYAKKMDELMTTGDRERSREAFQTNAQEKDKALKTILTNEQYVKFKEIEKQQQEQRPGPGRRP